MKIAHLPDTRIRGGYAVTSLKIVLNLDGIPRYLSGNVQGLFGPFFETWGMDGEHADSDGPRDMRNLILTDEHRRLIAEAKGGAHE